MADFTRHERLGLAISLTLFFALVAGGVILFSTAQPLQPWVGAPIAIAAITALATFVALVVRAARRQDDDGIEHEAATQASMITVIVLVVAGFGYSLLEAFAGVPRVTAAAASALAGGVWVASWTWLTRHFE